MQNDIRERNARIAQLRAKKGGTEVAAPAPAELPLTVAPVAASTTLEAAPREKPFVVGTYFTNETFARDLPPRPEEIAAAEKEVAKLSPEDKEQLGWGLSTIGFKVEKAKNDFFAGVFNKTLGKVDQKGTFGRFCKELRNSFVRDAEAAKQKGLAIQDGKDKAKFRNATLLVGNLARYGRLVTDFTGVSLASPFRYAMISAMAFTRGAEAAKEARFQNEELIDQTRMDLEAAQEEAFRIYDPKWIDYSAKEIQEGYLQQMPKDLLDRLKDPRTSNSFVQRQVAWLMEKNLEKLQGSLEAIAKGGTLTNSNDIRERQLKELQKWERTLKDYDRAITRIGTIDQLATAGLVAQKLGKIAVAGLTIETLYLSAEKVIGEISHLLSHEGVTSLPPDNASVKAPPQASDKASLAPGERGSIPSQYGAKLTPPPDSTSPNFDRTKMANPFYPLQQPTGNTITPEMPNAPLAQNIPPVGRGAGSLGQQMGQSGRGPGPLGQQAPGAGRVSGPAPTETSTPRVAPPTTESAAPKVAVQTPEPSPAPAQSPQSSVGSAEIKFEGGKGGIKGILEFKAAMRGNYKDLSVLPKEMQDFLNDQSPARNLQMAKDMGFFAPDQDAESAHILEGSTLKYDEATGKIIFHDAHTGEDVEKYTGKMFDSDKGAGAAQALKESELPGAEVPAPVDPVKAPEPTPTPAPETEPAPVTPKEKIILDQVETARTKVMEGYTGGRPDGNSVIHTLTPPQEGPIVSEPIHTLTPAQPYPRFAEPIRTLSGPRSGWWGWGGQIHESPIQTAMRTGIPSDFAANPFHLNDEALIEAYQATKSNLGRIFDNPDKMEQWNKLAKQGAKAFIKHKAEAGGGTQMHNAVLGYMQWLKRISGVEPKGGFFRHDETIKEYAIRAMQRVVQKEKWSQ